MPKSRTLIVALMSTWCVATVIVQSQRLNSFAGKYRFVYGRQYDCEVGEHGFDGSTRHYIRTSHFNPRRRFDPQTLSGNVTRARPFNDSFWGLINMAVWSNNHWKENAFHLWLPSGACTNLHLQEPGMFRMNGGAINPSGQCSMPAGTFTYSNFKYDMNWTKFPVLTYGRFKLVRTEGVVGSEKTSDLCMHQEVDIIAMP